MSCKCQLCEYNKEFRNILESIQCIETTAPKDGVSKRLTQFYNKLFIEIEGLSLDLYSAKEQNKILKDEINRMGVRI